MYIFATTPQIKQLNPTSTFKKILSLILLLSEHFYEIFLSTDTDKTINLLRITELK